MSKWPPNYPWWDKHYYTDEWQHDALGPALGDERAGHNYNAIWGKTVQLDPGKSVTAVSTQGFPINVVMAFQLRFADNANGPFTAVIPPTFNGVVVKLTKSIDLKAGKAEESFEIDTGFSQSVCTVICRQLTIIVTAQENAAPIFIQCAACVVETVDCNDITPNPPGPPTGERVIVEGYDTMFFAGRFNAADNVFPGINHILDPDPLRRQLYIQNYSNTDVAIGFGLANIIWTAGSEQMSVILPAGISAIYESPVGWFRGDVYISFKPGGDTPTGFLIASFGR